MKLTLRDLFWLVLVAALGIAWWIESGVAKSYRERDQRIQKLLSRHFGENEIPAELLQVYDDFVKIAATAPTPKSLEPFCLPNSVNIVEGAMRLDQEYGEGIQTYFMKTGFSPEILASGGDEETFYLRTGSSHLAFVLAPSGWKLYRYFDKPIE